jgi:hypothetical protein
MSYHREKPATKEVDTALFESIDQHRHHCRLCSQMGGWLMDVLEKGSDTNPLHFI